MHPFTWPFDLRVMAGAMDVSSPRQIIQRWTSKRRHNLLNAVEEDPEEEQIPSTSSSKEEEWSLEASSRSVPRSPKRLSMAGAMASSSSSKCKRACVAEIIYNGAGGVLAAASSHVVVAGGGGGGWPYAWTPWNTSSTSTSSAKEWTQLPSPPIPKLHILGFQFTKGLLLLVDSPAPPLWNVVSFGKRAMLALVVWDVSEGRQVKKICVLRDNTVEDTRLTIQNDQFSVVNFGVKDGALELDVVFRVKKLIMSARTAHAGAYGAGPGREAWVLGKYKRVGPKPGFHLHTMSDDVADTSRCLGRWVARAGALYMLSYSPQWDTMELFRCGERAPPASWTKLLGSPALEGDDEPGPGHGRLRSFTILDRKGSLLLLYGTWTSTEDEEGTGMQVSFTIAELEVRGGGAVVGPALARSPPISCFRETLPMEWSLAATDGTVHVTLGSLRQRLVCDLSDRPASWRLAPRCTETLVLDGDLEGSGERSGAGFRYFAMPLPPQVDDA